MPITNKRKAMCYSVKCLVLVLFFSITSFGQTKDEDVFAPIPGALRTRLVERLRLLTEYQREQQWENQYKMLSVLVTQGESKEHHRKRLKKLYARGLGDLLVDFTPESVTYQGGGPSDAVIFGCVKLRKNGSIQELYGSVEAYREKEDWYFSPIGVITAVGGKPEPCPDSSVKVP